jgi:hypothetical protein
MNRDLILWSTILGGPLVWMVSFGAGWSLAWWACIWNWTPAMYAISGGALALTIAGGLAAWTQWRKLGGGLPGEAGGAIPRARAMAIGGRPDRFRKPWPDVLLAADARGLQVIDTEARDRARQVLLRRMDRGIVRAAPADVTFLHDVFGIGGRAEHAIRDREQ